MGFSLPAAIAAQLTARSGRVVALCGDGGFQMVAGELVTMVQYGLPVVVVVVANGVLANVLAQQAVPYGTILHNSDFTALARACGAVGVVVDGTTDVDAVLRAAFAQRERPTLVELRCDPAVMAPLHRWEPNAAARLGD